MRGNPLRELRLPAHSAAVVTGAICVARLILPSEPEQIDSVVDERTVQFMRGGADYWHAMDRALRSVYGPASTIRAFRMPTIFVVWRELPDATWWPLYVAMAAGCGYLALRLSGRQWALPAVTALMLAYGRGPGYQQYMLVEPWAVPAVLGCLLAVRRERWATAALLGLLAALVREQAVLLLVAGCAVAAIRRLPWRSWAAATGIWVAAATFQYLEVRPLLVAHGTETPLSGADHGLLSVVRMGAFGLPLRGLLFPVLYGLAVWSLRRGVAAWPVLAAWLAAPLTGLLVSRAYWGMLTVPVLVAVVAMVPDRSWSPRSAGRTGSGVPALPPPSRDERDAVLDAGRGAVPPDREHALVPLAQTLPRGRPKM